MLTLGIIVYFPENETNKKVPFKEDNRPTLIHRPKSYGNDVVVR